MDHIDCKFKITLIKLIVIKIKGSNGLKSQNMMTKIVFSYMHGKLVPTTYRCNDSNFQMHTNCDFLRAIKVHMDI